MPIAFTIRITKKIIDHAKFCGGREQQTIGENCAIAVAIKDLFPTAFVSSNYIHPFGFEQAGISIELPPVARDFIRVFDSLVAMPKVRMMLPEFEFLISIPDKLLEQINIEEITTMPERTRTLVAEALVY